MDFFKLKAKERYLEKKIVSFKHRKIIGSKVWTFLKIAKNAN